MQGRCVCHGHGKSVGVSPIVCAHGPPIASRAQGFPPSAERANPDAMREIGNWKGAPVERVQRVLRTPHRFRCSLPPHRPRTEVLAESLPPPPLAGAPPTAPLSNGVERLAILFSVSRRGAPCDGAAPAATRRRPSIWWNWCGGCRAAISPAALIRFDDILEDRWSAPRRLLREAIAQSRLPGRYRAFREMQAAKPRGGAAMESRRRWQLGLEVRQQGDC